MAEVKSGLVNQAGISHQQAIVKRMLRKKIKPKVHVIPGGKDLLKLVDGRTLPRAIFTWLRAVRWFDECKLQLVTDTEARQSKTYRAEEFPDTGTKNNIWDQANGGKELLAEKLAEYLTSTKLISISVKRDGIYLTVPDGGSEISPEDEDWAPFLEFMPKSKGEYAF